MNDNSPKENVLLSKSFAFAVSIINVCKELKMFQKEFILSRQLIRSGTAIGALIKEAQNAESKADFVHKLGIAQKECGETIYWLELLKATSYLEEVHFEKLNTDATELLKIITSIIITMKKKLYNL